MNQVTVAVQQDVAVVAVFDLEEIRDYGVPRERFRKVALGTGKFCGGWIAIGLKKSVSGRLNAGFGTTHILEMIHQSDMPQMFSR